MRRTSQKGLTLVETLIAMAILAAVSLSAFALLSQSARFAASEQDRLAAGVIADNLLIEDLLAATRPEIGEKAGETQFGAQTYAWKRAVTEATERFVVIRYEVMRPGEARILATAQSMREAE